MEEPWLSFQLGGEEYLHAVDSVREIIPYETPNAVPGGDANNLGMLTLRGEVVAIFSGRGLLSMPERAPSDESKIITFITDNGPFGVVVDDVSEIIHVDPKAIDYASDKDGRATQGTLQHGGRFYIVIDFTERVRLDSDEP